MCGIAGFAGRSTADGLDRMIAVLRHRGPDGTGARAFRGPLGWTGLASARLAIQDLGRDANMPMSTDDGRFTIAYNGEVYNFPELRRELVAKGRSFRTRGDTEVVLAAYREWGPECLRRFNGMFAMAVWDSREHTLFLARDHFGIKPLYVARLPGGLAFASEAKALLELSELSAAVSPKALARYLAFLWVPEPGSIFEGVERLPAAHYCLYRGGSPTWVRWWDVRFPPASAPLGRGESPGCRESLGQPAMPKRPTPPGRRARPARPARDVAEELRTRFTAAVKAQMLSDVPVGAFLSAGLDSSSVVAAMAEGSSAQVRTFTVAALPGGARSAYGFDDPGVAERTAKRLGCAHTSLVLDADVADLLPRLAWHLDEPVADPAVFAAYMVSRTAARDVKVLLSGVGGDEVFAGYRKYRAHGLAVRYQRLPRLLRSRVLEPAAARAPLMTGTRLAPVARLVKKMARSASLPPVERFVADGMRMNGGEVAALLADDLREEVCAGDLRDAHLQAFARTADADFLDQMLYVDMATFMPSLNLLYSDRTSMAASVEVRVPFLDKDLVEWVAASVPPRLKLAGAETKHVLRRAMGDAVGREVLRQPKAGFGAPVDVWLRGELAEMLGDLLSPDRVRRRGFFKLEAVQDLLRRHEEGREDLSYQLWQLLAFEAWAERFLG